MFDFLKKNQDDASAEELQSSVDDVQETEVASLSQAAELSDDELPSDKICDLVDYIVSSIIDYPDELELEVTDAPTSTLIEIHANPSDCGKIIGKQGNTIKSLRILARALGSRLGLMVDIQVVD